VGKELAVANPLASEIATAVASLGLQTMLDAWKRHPKDWANPGRVKVCLKEGKGGPMGVKNSESAGVLSGLHEINGSKISIVLVPMCRREMLPTQKSMEGPLSSTFEVGVCAGLT